MNPRTGLVYVSNLSDSTVSVIDGRTSTAVATVQVGQQPEGLPGGQRRVGDRRRTSAVTATVAVSGFPQALAVDSQRDALYVSQFFGNTVSVLRQPRPER